MSNQTISLASIGDTSGLTVPQGAKGALIAFEHASETGRVARYWRQSNDAPTATNGMGCLNNDKLELTREELRSFQAIALVASVTIQVDYDMIEEK